MENPHEFIRTGGIQVAFPFKPYPPQEKYMQKVVQAISGKHNAILESPTGTGKTLSLLCSSLAWQQSQSKDNNMIYYTSRTHLQLSQAAREMKQTAYRAVPSVVIGSRAQMCLNDEVREQPNHLINRSCRNAIAKNGCAYYTNYEQKMETMDQNVVHDIEDLYQFGRSHQCCPYYAAKKFAETKASIVFMPYNYLLDTSIGKSTQLRLENSVIIFDEAHNIESSLSDAASGQFRESCLKTILESCSKLPEKISDALNREKGLTRFGYDMNQKKSDVVDEFATKKNGKQKEDKEPKINLIEELAEKLTTERIREVCNCADLLRTKARDIMKLNQTCDIQQVYEVLTESYIKYSTSSQILTTLDSMVTFWSFAGVMNVNQVSKYVTALGNLNHFLNLLYPEENLSRVKQNNHEKKLHATYKAHLKGIYKEDGPVVDGTLIDWELHIWCLSPAIGLERVLDSRCINGPRSLIITSGTLTPMSEVIASLGRHFEICEGFDHVIDKEQLKIVLVGESPKGYALKATYQGIQRTQFYKELGDTLLPTLKLLPFGTLVFFSSYNLMNKTLKEWTRSHLWTLLTRSSSHFIEKQSKQDFENDLSNYKRKINANERAIFFGVCRGKLSEGVNLKGHECRTVLVIGLPFPNQADPKVQATIEFNKKRFHDFWYANQMRRALNQTIGRVIRSKDDYGMLILCDTRFKDMQLGISAWARAFYPKETTKITKVESEIKEFFTSHGVDINQTANIASSSDPGAFEFDSSIHRPNPRAILSNAGNLAPKQKDGIAAERTSNSQPTSSHLAIFRKIHDSTEPKRNPKNLSAEERLKQVKSQYTLSKEKFNNIRKSLGPESDETQQAKKPKTSMAISTIDIFNSICEPSRSPVKVNSAHEYKCYVCTQTARDPYAANCSCGRVGCRDCLVKTLHKKQCQKCGEIWNKNKFKHLLFHSATLKKHKANRFSKFKKPVINRAGDETTSLTDPNTQESVEIVSEIPATTRSSHDIDIIEIS